MPITGPNRKYSNIQDYASEFILFKGFVFGPKQVEAFYREEAVDGLRTTTVIFPPNKQTVPDPDWELYDYFLKRTHPMDVKDLMPKKEAPEE